MSGQAGRAVFGAGAAAVGGATVAGRAVADAGLDAGRGVMQAASKVCKRTSPVSDTLFPLHPIWAESCAFGSCSQSRTYIIMPETPRGCIC